MSNVTYSAGNLTITVAGLDTVEQALGDLKRKTPAAAKVAINATARQARKLMVAKAKTRYAVNAAGRRHLKDLVQRKKASNSSLMAELHIAKMPARRCRRTLPEWTLRTGRAFGKPRY